MFLLENSHFLLFLNDHRVLLKKKKLCDRLKIAKSVNFPVKSQEVHAYTLTKR